MQGGSSSVAVDDTQDSLKMHVVAIFLSRNVAEYLAEASLLDADSKTIQSSHVSALQHKAERKTCLPCTQGRNG